MPAFPSKPVHGDRQHAGKVIVSAGENDASIPHPSLPELLASRIQFRNGAAQFDRHLAPELEDGSLLIGRLGA